MTLTEARRPPLERRRQAIIYRLIVRILTFGFWSSIALMLAGVTLAIAQGNELPTETDSLDEVLPAAARLEPRALIELGVLLLLLTPFSYVVAALVAYARQRDRAFVGICLLLIALIGGSIALGLWG
jgi:uncharacterized membrane protein